MTTATRLLNQFHGDGKTTKKQALNQTLDRAGIVASARGGTVTDALKEQITARAEEIWKK
jgi:hypothetical protein